MSVVRRLALPFPAWPPMAARALEDRLHLVAVDSARWTTVHVALDRDGGAGRVRPLPLAHPTGLQVCGSELLVAGAAFGNGTPLLLRLDPDGGPPSRVPLTAGGRLARWPEPYCLGGRPLVIWAGFEGEAARLCAGRPDASDARSLWSTDHPSRLAACEAPGGIVVARVAGPDARLWITWLDGELCEAASVAAATDVTAVAAARSAGATAVAWTTPDGLHLQWFDRGVSLGPATRLTEPERPGSLRSLRLVGDGADRLAVLYRVVPGGEERASPRAPREWLVVVEPGPGPLGPPLPIEPPGPGAGTGGWLGSRFLFAHAGRAALLSIYEPELVPRPRFELGTP